MDTYRDFLSGNIKKATVRLGFGYFWSELQLREVNIVIYYYHMLYLVERKPTVMEYCTVPLLTTTFLMSDIVTYMCDSVEFISKGWLLYFLVFCTRNLSNIMRYYFGKWSFYTYFCWFNYFVETGVFLRVYL